MKMHWKSIRTNDEFWIAVCGYTINKKSAYWYDKLFVDDMDIVDRKRCKNTTVFRLTMKTLALRRDQMKRKIENNDQIRS